MMYPWTKRDLEICIYDMKCADDEDRTSVRAEIAKSSGFTGLCILHRLRALYGFDVLKHLVIDVMHNIPLNVVRNHIYHYIDDGIIPAHVLEERLLKIPWTQELKNGRVPALLTKHLGYWKAEDFRKFAYPASEYCLGVLLPD